MRRRLHLLLILSIMVIMAGCGGGKKAVRIKTPDIPVIEDYFNGALLDPTAVAFDSSAHWYSKFLWACEEPVLAPLDSAIFESYRFLWLRTMHHPVVIRAEQKGTALILAVKVLDGLGGFDPGESFVGLQRELKKEEWISVKSAVDSALFWDLKTFAVPVNADSAKTETPDRIAQWVFEGRDADRYHVVDRASPKSGRFRALCLRLLNLSGLTVIDVY